MQRISRTFAITVALIAATSLVWAGQSAGGAAAAASTVTGTVFQDFNSNGAVDTVVKAGEAADIGVAGVTVAAYDSTGKKVGEATSAADGTYAMTITGNAGSDLRVEFTIPASNPLSSYRSSFAGTNSGTSVQFVSIGATNVDYGINVPGE